MQINKIESGKAGSEVTKEGLMVENSMLRSQFEDLERKREKSDFLYNIFAEYETKVKPQLESYVALASKVPENLQEEDNLRAELIKVSTLLSSFTSKLAEGSSPFGVAGIRSSLDVAPDARYSEAEQIKRYGGKTGKLPDEKQMDTWEITKATINGFSQKLQEVQTMLGYLGFTPPWGPHDKHDVIERGILKEEK